MAERPSTRPELEHEAGSGEEQVEVLQVLTAHELKEQGNRAYGAGHVDRAVELWMQALKAHVEEMQGGKGLSCLSEESRVFERSLYLNLAQGQLKLGEPDKALRACQVVLSEQADNLKARYRAVEACLALGRLEEAQKCLEPLLKGELAPEVRALVRKLKEAKSAEAAQRRELERRMGQGASGFSEGRRAEPEPSSLLAALGPNPGQVALGTELAEAAAKAAASRDARLAQGPPLPEPRVTDLEAFMAKAQARSKTYAAAAERSRQRSTAATRSVQLDWLRAGRDAADLGDFVSQLQAEVREIEVQQGLEEDVAGAAEESRTGLEEMD